MARKRYDNVFGTATGNPISCPAGAGTATLSSAPTGLPAVTSPDFVVLIIEPGTANEDIRYATYSGSGTSLTVSAAQEGTTGISHAGVAWAHGPTAADFATTTFPTSSGSGSPQGVVTDSFGASYADTANGGLYYENNTSGFVSPPNDWLLNTATTTAIGSGSPIPGGPIMDQSDQYLYLLSDNISPSAGIALSDVLAIGSGGTFNGFFIGNTGTDGSQSATLRLGAGGAFSWEFDNLGRTILPGLLVLDTLQLGNGVVTPTSGSPYAMTGTELLVIHNASVTLPDPVANGFNVYWIKDKGTGALVLHEHGSELIDGHASLTFAAYEAVCVFSDFSTWYVISANAGAVV